MVKNKLAIAKNFNIQFSEIDKLEYWEYEYYLDEINKQNKEEEKRQKEQEKSQKSGAYDPSKYMAKLQNSYKMPSFTMPKL